MGIESKTPTVFFAVCETCDDRGPKRFDETDAAEAAWEAERDRNHDLDQENPVDCSAETWLGIYARHPELLDR